MPSDPTPYADLSEREKDSDREWADKMLALIQSHASREDAPATDG